MSDYDFNIISEEELYNSANESFQKASNAVGSYMGIYGLSSMMFALLVLLQKKYIEINSYVLFDFRWIRFF